MWKDLHTPMTLGISIIVTASIYYFYSVNAYYYYCFCYLTIAPWDRYHCPHVIHAKIQTPVKWLSQGFTVISSKTCFRNPRPRPPTRQMCVYLYTPYKYIQKCRQTKQTVYIVLFSTSHVENNFMSVHTPF